MVVVVSPMTYLLVIAALLVLAAVVFLIMEPFRWLGLRKMRAAIQSDRSARETQRRAAQAELDRMDAEYKALFPNGYNPHDRDHCEKQWNWQNENFAKLDGLRAIASRM